MHCKELLVFRYNSTTGQFVVPTGGAGLYFLYTNFLADEQEFANFFIRVNDQAICGAFSDMNDIGVNDNGTPSCGSVAILIEGIKFLRFESIII